MFEESCDPRTPSTSERRRKGPLHPSNDGGVDGERATRSSRSLVLRRGNVGENKRAAADSGGDKPHRGASHP